MKKHIRVLIMGLMAITMAACNTDNNADCDEWYTGDPCQPITSSFSGLYDGVGQCGNTGILMIPSDSLPNGFYITLVGTGGTIWAELLSETEMELPSQYVAGGNITGTGTVEGDDISFTYSATTGGGSFSCTYKCTPTASNEGDMQATVAGAPWTADLALTANISNGDLDISGIAEDGKQMRLLLSDFESMGVGTYQLNQGSQSYAYVNTGSNDESKIFFTYFEQASGSIEITTATSTEVAGTFSFTAIGELASYGSVSVTNGTFNISL